MKKSHFLLFLSLMGFGSLACADSFYAGFQAGADFFTNKKKISAEILEGVPLAPIPELTVFSAQNKIAGLGGTGGLFLGYAWQFQDGSVGVEIFGNGDGSNTKQIVVNDNNRNNVNFQAIERLKGVFGVTVKPGYLINEKARLYVKAGWAKGRFTVEGPQAGYLGTTTAVNGRIAKWVGAWIAGFGSEIFISPNLALSLEYNHIQYQKQTFVSDFVLEPEFNTTLRTTAQYRPQSNNVLIGLTYFFTSQDNGFSLDTKDDGGYDAYTS